MAEDIKKELEEQINYTIEIINNLDNNNIEEFLNNAIDILFIKGSCENNLYGFSILINVGNPYIELRYIRNEAKIIALWGNTEISKDIDIEKAQMILDYLDILK